MTGLEYTYQLYKELLDMKLPILFIGILFANLTFAASDLKPLPTAPFVDVSRYIGKWYVITTLPQFFSKSCLGQTAEYKVLTPNSISVLNTCYKKNKKTGTISGKAVVTNARTNSELVVTFDSFFTKLFNVKGDYNIIFLDPNYQFVIVGSRDRKSLWIMSRTPSMPPDILQRYVSYSRSIGFDISKLVPSKW
jgi:apolipoprotein D and lipocalin family protein